jgi:EmrB/QacA subfamily drug resistance transporter
VIRFGTTQGRWVIAATVLGSGVVFLDGTVVNVALPSIASDLHTDLAGLQWVLDAYLVTLTAFLLLGGSLGDRLGRKRVFLAGLVAFTAASVICALAPNATTLSLARALQGVGGAFLVPGSLAILAASFDEADRGRAVGSWSGLAGVASAIGPFLGGWLIDAWSWRLVFLINLPLAAVTFFITVRHVPESHADHPLPVDVTGAALASVGLATACYALIEGENSLTPGVVISGVIAIVAIVSFLVVEARSPHPMLPLRLFRSTQFSGANATTLAVYGALGAATFLVVLELQLALGYSAIEAGASLLPLTVITLLLSSRMGALAQRIGARIPMTVGPIVVGIGMLLFTRVHPGVSYWTTAFPAATVFAFGLAITVAPLTATVLASVAPDELGVASGVNNAAARLASLLAVAVLPAIANIDTTLPPVVFSDRVGDALRLCAALAFAGGLIAFATIRRQAKVMVVRQATVSQACNDPCLAETA